MILAADIGATKALFGLYDLEEGRPVPVFVQKYPSRDLSGAAGGLELFLRQSRTHCRTESVQSACLALAGTREGESFSLVNLGWTVEPAELSSLLPKGCAISLVNDMEALAAALPYLPPERMDVLRPGPRAFGSLALLAPGTGLGVSFVLSGIAHPSEGGHCAFAPASPAEVRLWEYLHGLYGHVSLERVLSGEGLCALAWFMAREAGENGGDIPGNAEEVTRRAREKTCPHCVKAAEAFTRILAREAGHLALTFLPRDGVVLGGGIPPALLSYLHSEDFERAFLDQGRFSRWMEKVPVSVVLDPAAALLGAAVLAASAGRETRCGV